MLALASNSPPALPFTTDANFPPREAVGQSWVANYEVQTTQRMTQPKKDANTETLANQ